MSWLSNLFARRTAPDPSPGGLQSIWLPARKGGVVVTQESALQLSACFACIRVISADIAKLPWHVFAESNGRRTKLTRSPIGYLLNTRPNPNTGAFAFRETLVSWALTWGAGYAEIERDSLGRPVALWQVSPDRVRKLAGSGGVTYYEITNSVGEPTILPAEDVFDLHGLGFDGLTGYSTIALAAQSIGFGIAAEQHGSAFYGNNAALGLVLEHPAAISDNAYQRLKASLDERKGAGAYRPWIVEEGMKVTVPTTKQVDAQYVETRKMQIEEICRWFRVPLQKIMNQDHAHYSSVEQMNISYATDTLGEWIKRLEEEADHKLIGARSQASYTKINTRALMRGDSAAQSAWYREMRNIGVYSVNEIRELEDLDPVPGGEKRVLQVNMTTLEKIGEEAKEEPEEATPEEVADATLTATVKRLLKWDDEQYAKAIERGEMRDFDAWIERHKRYNAARRKREFASIADSLGIAYRTMVDADRLAMLFEDASADRLSDIHRGELSDALPSIMDHLRIAL